MFMKQFSICRISASSVAESAAETSHGRMIARRLPVYTILLGLPALFLGFSPVLSQVCQYDYHAIANGQVWRLITQHWTHWNGDHLFWDLITFIGLGAACEYRDRKSFIRVIAPTSVVISLALFTAQPSLLICRGLSGLDSALFGLLITRLYLDQGRTNRPLRTLCLTAAALFFVKTLIETGTGTTLFVDSRQALMIPVPLCHLSGFISGCLLASPSSLAIFRALAHMNSSRRPLKKELNPVEAMKAS